MSLNWLFWLTNVSKIKSIQFTKDIKLIKGESLHTVETGAWQGLLFLLKQQGDINKLLIKFFYWNIFQIIIQFKLLIWQTRPSIHEDAVCVKHPVLGEFLLFCGWPGSTRAANRCNSKWRCVGMGSKANHQHHKKLQSPVNALHFIPLGINA